MTTKRPLNRCRACLHTWYPRGTDRSRACPACQSWSVTLESIYSKEESPHAAYIRKIQEEQARNRKRRLDRKKKIKEGEAKKQREKERDDGRKQLEELIAARPTVNKHDKPRNVEVAVKHLQEKGSMAKRGVETKSFWRRAGDFLKKLSPLKKSSEK